MYVCMCACMCENVFLHKYITAKKTALTHALISLLKDNYTLHKTLAQIVS